MVGCVFQKHLLLYAKMSAALCIKNGVVTGSSATTLSPKAYVTRAEVAVMVERLLQKSGLIWAEAK